MSEKKVLVVDYDQNSLERMKDLFCAQNMEVVTASDGQEAYEVYTKIKPDLIVLEAMLPKLHGFDLTQKIHRETSGSVPVVIVTALYKGPQYKNEALRTFGASGYFEKPVNDEKLLNFVLNLLHDEIEIEEEIPLPKEVAAILKDIEKQMRKESS
ncbi:MAG: response regulator [Candidatus Aminicenantes bacterium]